MKKFLDEFKNFALKGNVFDLAVGVLIGASFQSIVKSLVDDIISPIIGIFGNKNFDNQVLDIFGVTIRYGAFLTAVINFIIMAFIIFLMIKGINKLMTFGNKKDTTPEVTTKECSFCCSKISIKATRCPNCTSVLEENSCE